MKTNLNRRLSCTRFGLLCQLDTWSGLTQACDVCDFTSADHTPKYSNMPFVWFSPRSVLAAVRAGDVEISPRTPRGYCTATLTAQGRDCLARSYRTNPDGSVILGELHPQE